MEKKIIENALILTISELAAGMVRTIVQWPSYNAGLYKLYHERASETMVIGKLTLDPRSPVTTSRNHICSNVVLLFFWENLWCQKPSGYSVRFYVWMVMFQISLRPLWLNLSSARENERDREKRDDGWDV